MGIVLTEQYSEEALARMFDQMEFFAMGHSYGGYESLLIPSKLQYCRQSGVESYTSTMLRLYVGLEDYDDLIQDLDKGLARLKHS
jgi:cystathionine beta-lyase